jgi:urea-proton symporter
VKVRFGTAAHLLFTFYGVLCNLVVCGSLLCAWPFKVHQDTALLTQLIQVGGAATVNALTGMNIDAACFLLPVGIAICEFPNGATIKSLTGLPVFAKRHDASADVVFGGLRATFICDWSHTLILFIIIYIFVFRTLSVSTSILIAFFISLPF